MIIIPKKYRLSSKMKKEKEHKLLTEKLLKSVAEINFLKEIFTGKL